MTIVEIVKAVQRLDGRLEVAGSRIRAHTRGGLPPQLRGEIRQNKAALLLWLQTPVHLLPDEDIRALGYTRTVDALWPKS